MKKDHSAIHRRDFIKVCFLAGAGLMVTSYAAPSSRARAAQQDQTILQDGQLVPNAWIRISPQGPVTVMINHSEMGQGITTAMSMIVADELEADWSQVTTRFAPVAPVYRNPAFKAQGTGGSTSIKTTYQPLRIVAAATREMLVAAAAAKWGVAPGQCRAIQGRVHNQTNGQSLAYGQLLEAASRLQPPASPRLKSADQFRLIGKSVRRLDSADKARGKTVFGADVKLPGLLNATVVHPPTMGGSLKSVDASKAKSMPGVRHVMQIEAGVAVVADTFWQALQAAEALECVWEAGPLDSLSSQGIMKHYAELAQESGDTVREQGDAAAALSSAAKRLRSVYTLPYQAHACPEPMNCTAWVRRDSCQVWAPTQGQDAAREAAAWVCGLDPEQVEVHTTYLGGGFGGRYQPDCVKEAVEVAKQAGAPVKLMWTRNEDMRNDYFRPASYNEVEAGLDAQGMPVAWAHRTVCQVDNEALVESTAPAIMPTWLPSFMRHGVAGAAAWLVNRSKGPAAAMSGAVEMPYAIANIKMDYVKDDPGVPVGPWRSVGDSRNAFVIESFMDEIAAAGGHDPVQLRLRLLEDAPRHAGVLKLAAQKAGWGQPNADGVFRGVALHAFHGTPAAIVAEVSLAKGGQVKVRRVVCAVDCGVVINPAIVRAQMVSGIVFGLSAALKSSITLKNGRVQQSNFHDFAIMTMDEMPKVEVHIVPSQEKPGGIGEVGVPPIAPAVTNAIFAATGKRAYSIPVIPQDLV